MTPYALHQLGTPLFAIWSFQTMVVALFTISNFGFTNGLVFYLARRLDEREEVNRYFNVAFFSYLLEGGALFSLIVVGSGVFSAVVLKVPNELHAEAVFVLNVTAFGLWLRFMAAPYQALLEAPQEHGFVQAITLIWLLVHFLGSIA